MDRARKEALVSSLHETFAGAGVVVVTHNAGLSVAQMSDLRRRMRDAGASFKVTKNRLARIALEGTPYADIGDLFTGPTGVAFSSDPVAAAKVVVDYANENDRFTIVGGGLGSVAIDAEGVKALAKMPPIEELRAKLLAVIVAPASQIVGILPAPATKVAGVVSAGAAKLVRVLQARAAQAE